MVSLSYHTAKIDVKLILAHPLNLNMVLFTKSYAELKIKLIFNSDTAPWLTKDVTGTHRTV